MQSLDNQYTRLVPGLFMRSTADTTTSSAGESLGPSLKIGIGSMPGTTAGQYCFRQKEKRR